MAALARPVPKAQSERPAQPAAPRTASLAQLAERNAQLNGATDRVRTIVHDLAALSRAVTPRTKLLFVCNPNNPTGTSVGAEAFDRFVFVVGLGVGLAGGLEQHHAPPSMGLAPTTADFIFERLIEIRRQSKLTILLVEQRVAEALESADHGYVLEAGRVALEGNNQTLRADDRIRKAYLGM